MKQMLHINHCNTLQNRAVPTNGPVLYSTLYEDKGNGNRDGKERGHIQPLADRELQGKVGKRFFSDGKAKPRGVSGKIILAGGCGIFPESLALPEAFAVGPL